MKLLGKHVVLSVFLLLLSVNFSVADEKLSVSDVLLDYSILQEKTVKVSGYIFQVGEMVFLYEKPGNTTALYVEISDLPRSDRKRLLTGCSSDMCKVTVVGVPEDVLLNKGIRAKSLYEKGQQDPVSIVTDGYCTGITEVKMGNLFKNAVDPETGKLIFNESDFSLSPNRELVTFRGHSPSSHQGEVDMLCAFKIDYKSETFKTLGCDVTPVGREKHRMDKDELSQMFLFFAKNQKKI